MNALFVLRAEHSNKIRKGEAMNIAEKRLYLIEYLLGEQEKYCGVKIPQSEQEQKQLLRTLLNVREPKTADSEFLRVQDEYLAERLSEKGVEDYKTLTPAEEGIYLWQGDITTLKCDAIVNAANSQMLGCFVPNHSCIDNAIHTFAGVQLRQECFEIMQSQGFEEPTGRAKITSAYNLPSRYVIHTVGPIVRSELTQSNCDLLRSCYNSCLESAVQNSIKSIAFCCISTGVFGFPNDKAAEIAVDTVRKFRQNHGEIEVIFNVFKDEDFHIYRRLLGKSK